MPARTAEIFLGLIINPLCSSFAFKYQKSLQKSQSCTRWFLHESLVVVDDGGFAILLEQNKVRRLVPSLPPPPPSMLVFWPEWGNHGETTSTTTSSKAPCSPNTHRCEVVGDIREGNGQTKTGNFRERERWGVFTVPQYWMIFSSNRCFDLYRREREIQVVGWWWLLSW